MSTLAPTTAPAVETRGACRAFDALLPALIGQVTHDLNNHLSQVLGKSELALMLGGEQRHKDGLEQVHDAGQAARILVSDLQRLTTWSQSSGEPVSISEGLALVDRLIRSKCERAGAELTQGSASGRATADRLAAASLLLWKLCSVALSAQEAASGGWTLSAQQSSAGWAMCLEGPERVWDPGARAAMAQDAQTDRQDEPASHAEARVWVQALRACGGQYTAQGTRHEISFSG